MEESSDNITYCGIICLIVFYVIRLHNRCNAQLSTIRGQSPVGEDCCPSVYMPTSCKFAAMIRCTRPTMIRPNICTNGSLTEMFII